MSAVGVSAVGLEAVAGADYSQGGSSTGVFFVEGFSSTDFQGGAKANSAFFISAASSALFRPASTFSIAGNTVVSPVLDAVVDTHPEMSFTIHGVTTMAAQLRKSRKISVAISGVASVLPRMGARSNGAFSVIAGSVVDAQGKECSLGAFSCGGAAALLLSGVSRSNSKTQIKSSTSTNFRSTYSFTQAPPAQRVDFELYATTRERVVYVLN